MVWKMYTCSLSVMAARRAGDTGRYTKGAEVQKACFEMIVKGWYRFGATHDFPTNYGEKL